MPAAGQLIGEPPVGLPVLQLQWPDSWPTARRLLALAVVGFIQRKRLGRAYPHLAESTLDMTSRAASTAALTALSAACARSISTLSGTVNTSTMPSPTPPATSRAFSSRLPRPVGASADSAAGVAFRKFSAALSHA